MELMTERQFSNLARESGITQKSKGYAAAKLVLVHGKTLSEAAREADMDAAGVSKVRSKMNTTLLGLPQRLIQIQEAMGK